MSEPEGLHRVLITYSYFSFHTMDGFKPTPLSIAYLVKQASQHTKLKSMVLFALVLGFIPKAKTFDLSGR